MLLQGAAAEQNTQLAGRMYTIIDRYGEDLGEDAANGLHNAVLMMLITGAQARVFSLGHTGC